MKREDIKEIAKMVVLIIVVLTIVYFFHDDYHNFLYGHSD